MIAEVVLIMVKKFNRMEPIFNIELDDLEGMRQCNKDNTSRNVVDFGEEKCILAELI